MAESIETINRDYVDNYSVKELVVDHIMPTYFPDMDQESLVTGETGMMAELIGTITEDAFNTGSSLIAESFPSRAKMESSIYSNASIFQLTNAFAEASECDFVLAIPEEDIKDNFITKPGKKYKYFYIDRDTTVDVEGKTFTLDYDIEIRAMYRESKGVWTYSAKYLMDDYKNSVSKKKDPYVKLKQYQGVIALTVTMSQYERTVIYESIVDNATLNYPVITIPYNGKLLGFDVMYKSPSDTDYNTQLETKVRYSLPEKKPFCYFKPIDDNTIELSFTTKDAYFQPKFNSELMITVYTTLGEDGNFEYYDGNEFVVSKGDRYEYQNSWMIAAKAISAATGGKERLSIEGLQRLTVEGYTTANALTTENDLQTYFDNYKYRYKSSVKFFKKRNDAVELLFSAFMYIKNGDYIYPTNTLTMDTNILEFEHKDGGFYNLDPGYLFGYKQDDLYLVPLFYYPVDGDGEYYDEEGHYFTSNGERQEEMDITVEKLKVKIKTKTVRASDASYWKLNHDTGNYDYYLSTGIVDNENHPSITSKEMADKIVEGSVKHTYRDSVDRTFDFIMDEAKENETRVNYFKYYETYKTENDKPNLTFEDYLYEYTINDYKRANKIDNRIMVFDTDFENFENEKKFMFTNPFIMTITETSGLISYFQTFISKNAELNFVKENDDDAFCQFITYHIDVSRDISKDKKYNFKLEIMPSIDADKDHPYITTIYDPENPDQFILHDDSKPSLSNFKKDLLSNNDLRIILTFLNADGSEAGYMEMIPTRDKDLNEHYVFEAELHTDDYITSSNTFRPIHICPHCGAEVLNSANFVNENKKYYCEECGNYFDEGIININENDSILLPIDGANVKITTLFRDYTDIAHTTNNEFTHYTDKYNGYIWTNIYNTQDDPITFIKPLDMMRSVITYKDFRSHGVNAMDCTISEIPLLKYSILAYKDEGMTITDPLLSDDIGKFQYFMDTFLGNYAILQEARRYLGGMGIDAKFYNSYGKSTNFMIGNDRDSELIDTNNISIELTITLIAGVDEFTCTEELKEYIKNYIETINSDGTNDLYISNLIRSVETDFAYVDHIVFTRINDYPTEYQSISNEFIGLDNLSKEQRRKFVPDILVINKNNVIINIIQPEI